MIYVVQYNKQRISFYIRHHAAFTYRENLETGCAGGQHSNEMDDVAHGLSHSVL